MAVKVEDAQRMAAAAKKSRSRPAPKGATRAGCSSSIFLVRVYPEVEDFSRSVHLFRLVLSQLGQHRLGKEGLTFREGGEVGGGHASDLGEGFLRQKGLVCSDENVGESEQAREFVVVQDLAGEILEEDAFLFLIDVERDPAKAFGFERLDQRPGVNERAAADVEQDSA